MRTVTVVALALLSTACGTDVQQRAATGAGTGILVGALVGGPVGAAAGAAVGGAVGWAAPEGADQLAQQGIDKGKQAYASLLGQRTAVATAGRPSAGQPGVTPPAEGEGSSAPESVSPATVRQAQSALRAQGLYHGRIDGIAGRQTQSALRRYQEHQGLPQTAQLDRATLGSLTAAGTAGSSTSRLSANQVTSHLQAAGYSDVSDVRPYGTTAYTARASQNGTDYVVDVDARSGSVMSRRSANAAAGSGSGGVPAAPGNAQDGGAVAPPPGH